SFEISIESMAAHGAVRLFFFRYDCHIDGVLRLSVRGGQAGFFTDDELAKSQGILWSPEDVAPRGELQLDDPILATEKRRFSAVEVQAFAEGRVADCFGSAFAAAQCHTRTPGIPAGPMLLFQRIEEFDPRGGPWQRGY